MHFVFALPVAVMLIGAPAGVGAAPSETIDAPPRGPVDRAEIMDRFRDNRVDHPRYRHRRGHYQTIPRGESKSVMQTVDVRRRR